MQEGIIFSLFAISPDGSVGMVSELEKIHPDLSIFRKQPQHPRCDRKDSNKNRKEVIQPPLPGQLPCYDLAPIANLTLVRSKLRPGFGYY